MREKKKSKIEYRKQKEREKTNRERIDIFLCERILILRHENGDEIKN